MKAKRSSDWRRPLNLLLVICCYWKCSQPWPSVCDQRKHCILFFFSRIVAPAVAAAATVAVAFGRITQDPDINFMCDWVLCVPHRYYYCFPINVGEQSISIVIHSPHSSPIFTLTHGYRQSMHTYSFHQPNFLYLTQNTRYGSFCIFSASNTCMCSNVTEQKPKSAHTLPIQTEVNWHSEYESS